mgnify:FL=1
MESAPDTQLAHDDRNLEEIDLSIREIRSRITVKAKAFLEAIRPINDVLRLFRELEEEGDRAP